MSTSRTSERFVRRTTVRGTKAVVLTLGSLLAGSLFAHEPAPALGPAAMPIGALTTPAAKPVAVLANLETADSASTSDSHPGFGKDACACRTVNEHLAVFVRYTQKQPSRAPSSGAPRRDDARHTPAAVR